MQNIKELDVHFLTQKQFLMLDAVVSSKEGCSQAEAGRHSISTYSHTAKVIKDLVTLGMLSDEKVGRERKLKATAKGKKLHSFYKQIQDAFPQA